MIEFSKQISDRWNISQGLSEQLCIAFQKGDTPYYLAEYKPEVAVELSLQSLWEIYDFLSEMEELGAKKKKLIQALKKAEKLSPALEKRINLSTNSFELDDLMIPLRPNPRSKGQIAAKKGIEPLANMFIKQDEEKKSLEELAAPFIGKDPTLKTTEDVLQSVKDLLAEQFAYDDTVRSMARDFVYDDGFFDVTPKNKKDPKFANYVGKNVSLQDLTKNEILELLNAEEQKTIRLKLGVQLFRITELLRHHFIVNPDFVGFDLICETIDDSWLRLLQPVIERDVKERLKKEAELWVSKQLYIELEKSYNKELQSGTILFVNAGHQKIAHFLVVNGFGDLLGTTSEKKPVDNKPIPGDRLRQFYSRHRPNRIVIIQNEQSPVALAMLEQILGTVDKSIVSYYEPDSSLPNPANSEWVTKSFGTLLDAMTSELYGLAIQFVKPSTLLPKLGLEYFTIHPMQALLASDKFTSILNRIITHAALLKGILLKDIVDSALKNLKNVTDETLQAIRASDTKESFATKNDLLRVANMSEVLFRNIAGFIIVNNAEEALDRSLVHPDHFEWVMDIAEQFDTSVESIVADPGMIRSYHEEDPIRKIFIEKKLISQIQIAQKHAPVAQPRIKRKLKLTELKEGTVTTGRVTNITPFGVFVNINAVCDGLIHISQLADEYVETPDQVVSINDKIEVRILKVDAKKRRISLSMKNLGNKAPRVKPSKGQLDNLAEFFKNR